MQPCFDQVERADEPVADPVTAGPGDGIAEWDRPLVFQQDQRRRRAVGNVLQDVPVLGSTQWREVALTGPLSSYLRVLTGRAVAPAPLDRITLPVRLYPRVLAIRLSDALAPESLVEALAWERAAVLSGRLMSEWALIHLCQLSGSAASSLSDAGRTAFQPA